MLKLSVIIPSVSGLSMLAEVLIALNQQICDFDYEIIIVNRLESYISQFIQKHYPEVKIINVSASTGIPEMRALAISQAVGEFLVITEDHCIPPKDWLTEIVNAHKNGYAIITGAVENASRRRLIDWAVFLCEYSSFMPPVVNGETDFIAGNNVSYQRTVIDNVDEDIVHNHWEYFLQSELQRVNLKILSVASLVIMHKKEFGFIYFLKQRFYYSRSFAAMRKSKSSIFKQIIYLLYMPVLPIHQIWKIFLNIRIKNRNYREFFWSLPLLIIFMISYMFGEFIGQMFGAGDSLAKVE